MHSENFKANFSQNGLNHTCILQKHVTSTFFWVEIWFQYQNNKQNLQIWDMQISQIAKF